MANRKWGKSMISKVYTYGYDTKYEGKIFHHSPRLVFGNKPEEIERYEEAIEDEVNLWVPHHVLEWKYSVEELISMNRYYNVNPDELIWIRYDYHSGFNYIHKANREYRLENHNSNSRGEATKGKKWYTDGVKDIRAFKCPKGFKEGRSNFNYTATHKPMTEEQKKFNGERFKKTKWYNNGVINKRCEERPKGFKEGRLEKDRLTLSNAMKNYYTWRNHKEKGWTTLPYDEWYVIYSKNPKYYKETDNG